MIESLKENLKICHLADLHLGYRRYNKLSERGFNQREVDVNQAFREAIDRIITIQPDCTLIAGDLFHTVRPSNAVITFAFKEIKRLADQTNAPVILLAGNHDTPKRVDSGSLLKLFQELDQVYISDHKVETFTFPKLNLAVTCLPHAVLEGKQKWNVRANDQFRFNILVTHAQVGNQFMSDFGGANLSFKQFVSGEWDYIALGHVHVYQEVTSQMVYSGAIEHTAKNIWQENTEKGFVEINLPSLTKTFYPLTAPRQLVMIPEIDVLALLPEQVMELLQQNIDSVVGGIEGKIVRIDLLNLTRQNYALLDHRKIKNWRALALNLMIDYRPPSENTYQVSGLQQQALPLKQELINFCTQQHVADSLVIDKLCSYLDALEVASEAD